MDVAEEDGNIIFLHKIVEGSASRSYGIHVAKLAGIPQSLLDRAREKLADLENGQNVCLSQPLPDTAKEDDQGRQISMFTGGEYDPLREKIKSIDLMEITPSQAIRILEELKGTIDDQDFR